MALTLIMAGEKWRQQKDDAKILDAPKVYTSLSGFETSIDVLFGHLRETEGGFIISVLLGPSLS
jgi:hypothetical protein